MHSMFIYSICCLSLLLIGFIVGQGFDFSIDNLSKIFSILASIATIFGVLVAFFSLNSWKKEFYNKKIDALINTLEDDYDNWFFYFLQNYRSKSKLTEKQNNKKLSIADIKEIEVLRKSEREDFQKAKEYENKYWKSYGKLSRYIKLDRESLINSAVLNRHFSEFIQDLFKIHAMENVDELLNRNFQKLIESKENCRKEYQKLRTNHCDIMT